MPHPNHNSGNVQVKLLLGSFGILLLLSSFSPRIYTRILKFSGYEWEVKQHSSREGPGPNYFSDSDSSVWVDTSGRLHLRLRIIEGKWHCAEVINTQSLTYGKLEFLCNALPTNWDKQCVLGLFSWSTDRSKHHRELDIEISEWGKNQPKWNAQYIVQPSSKKAGRFRFMINKNQVFTHSLDIGKKAIGFSSKASDSKFFKEFKKKKRFSHPEKAQARINLWLYQGKEPTGNQPIEVVISAFKFLPSQ